MQGYKEDEDNGGQGPKVEPGNSVSADPGRSNRDPCSCPRDGRVGSGGARPQEQARLGKHTLRGKTEPAREGAGLWRGAGHRLSPLGILLVCTAVLCLAGCGDQVRALTPEEQAAFDQAGSVAPMVDMDRIERAMLKTGPYRVVAGDILEVTMPVLLQAVTAAEVASTQRASQTVNPYLLRVRDNGTIALPAVGSMKVVGLPLSEIEEQITKAYEDYVIPHPSVFVRVAEYKAAKVYVAGAVKTPGVYALQADQMTLSSLLTLTGGITEAGAAVVRILRPESPAGISADAPIEGSSDANARPEASLVSSVSERTVPAEQASTRDTVPGHRQSKPILLPVVNTNIPFRDVALDEGDTVVVEPVQMPLFSVLGLVARPGNFPYPPGAHYNLTQAIAFAGGLDPVSRPYYATIYRLKEDGTVARAPFRLLQNDRFTDALGTPIRPGDVVAVENTPRTRLNTAIRDLFRINAGVYVTGRDLWDRN